MANTSLGTFRTRIEKVVARTDADTIAWIDRGVNFACLYIALAYNPQELRTMGNLTVLAAGSSVSMSTLTRPRVIERVYNATGANEVALIPFTKWGTVLPSGTGSVAYYSRFGETLYTAPSPLVNNTLDVYYNQYPLVVSDPTDLVSLTYYDPMIESLATSFTYASQEETDSSGLWGKMASLLGAPEDVMTAMRKKLEGDSVG